MTPARQCCNRLQAQYGFVTARTSNDANDGWQLFQIDRNYFGKRSCWRIATSLLTHDWVMRSHVCMSRNFSGCNHILRLTRSCIYANYAAGNFIGSSAHTCHTIEQRLLVVMGTKYLQNRCAKVFVHFVRRTLAIYLFGIMMRLCF